MSKPIIIEAVKFRLPHFIFLLAVSFSATNCAHRLTTFEDLLVGELAETVSENKSNAVKITYLGTNGYLIQSGETSIVVDPYFSRVGLRSTILNAPITSSRSAIDYATRAAGFPSRVDAWLVTHSHIDHLFDVPNLQMQFGGKIVTSLTGKHLCEAAVPDIRERDIYSSGPGKEYRFGKAKIHVLEARHDRVFGLTPYPGLITDPLESPPLRSRDWKLGTPLAFLIEIGGKRIYVESGGMPEHIPAVSHVDLAIIGVAVSDSQKRYAAAVKALKPRYVLPSHQDDFFTPIEKGFHFAATANFPRVKAVHEAEGLPGELILMDYFHTWVLE